MRMYPKAKVSEKAERALKGGHPWVYAEEVLSVDGDYTNGGLVDVYTKKDRFIGTGFINEIPKFAFASFHAMQTTGLTMTFSAGEFVTRLSTAKRSWETILTAAESSSVRPTVFPG